MNSFRFLLFVVWFCVGDACLLVAAPSPARLEREKEMALLPAGSSLLQDIVYAGKPEPGDDPDSRQTLDLFVPPGRGLFPLVIWIHGGGWHEGGKESGGINLARAFLPKGFALASIDYRYVQDACFPAQVEDSNAALIWLRQNAVRYCLDPDRVGVMGHSAGAHLAALMAVTGDGPTFTKGPVSVRVQAAVCWAPIADLDVDRGQWPARSFLRNPHDPAMKFYPGGNYDPVLARQASPVSHVHAGIPPILILHGAKDELVPLGQASTFADRLREAGVDVTFHVDPASGHNVMSAGATNEAIQFFQRTLQPSPSSP